MAIFRWRHLALLAISCLSVWGCATTPLLPAAMPEWQPGRYVQYSHRSPDFDPTGLRYAVEPLPVDFSQGLSQAQASAIVQEELLQALQANGLKIAEAQPEAVLSGQVRRFQVASPAWRFFSGRGWARIEALVAIRQGQDIVFACQDQVTVNPAVNPRHRPPLERELLARQAARRLAANILNELLLFPPLAARAPLPPP